MRHLLLPLLAVTVISSCSNPPSPVHSQREVDSLQYVAAHAKPNWQNLDLEEDGVFGISTEKAYENLLKHKKPKTTIVAIIDSGIDTLQEDLRPVLWTDSLTGLHGWNYIGPESGKEDFTQIIGNEKRFFDSLSQSPPPETYRLRYSAYQRTLADYHTHLKNLTIFIAKLNASKVTLDQMVGNMGNANPSLKDFRAYPPRTDMETRMLALILSNWQNYGNFSDLRYYQLDHLLDLAQFHLEHSLSLQPSASTDQKSTLQFRNNNDVSNDDIGLVEDPSVMPFHGTMVSGIVAAVRNNGKGINGIADDVRIMMLKVFSNIREMRDDELAGAIRFAVDHGASVISMSVGRVYSLHKETVDSAVQYAMSKNVLMIHAAGNSGLDLDADSNFWFPSPHYMGGGKAEAWITVGASNPLDDPTLVPSFSNYGREAVDVFAPGIEITSTIPHSNSTSWSGTSVAAPVVAGLAALLMEYYPDLTAVQVKQIIMKSVVKSPSLREKCVSGGVVNAFDALKLAAERY